MWQRQIQLPALGEGAAAKADRLRVVDDDDVPFALQALGVHRVDLVEDLPLLVAQRLLGALQRVVEELGRVEELFLAEDHVPVSVEADVPHQRHQRVEDLRDPAAEGGSADVQHPLPFERLRELANPLGQVFADDVGVVGEGLVAEGDFLKQGWSSTPMGGEMASSHGRGRATPSTRAGAVGPLAEGDVDVFALAVVEHGQRHHVAGLVGGDRFGEVVGPDDVLAFHLQDHVATGPVLGGLELQLFVAAFDPRLLGRAASDDLGDEAAEGRVEAELARQLRVERLSGDPDEGVFRSSVFAQLGDRVLDRRDRDGEPDPVVGAGVGLDLLVDAHHPGAGIEQRPARVARVDRGVGLDRPGDFEAGEGFDRAVGGGDDSDRERLLLAEGAADRGDGLSDPEVVVVSQPQRVQFEPVGLDLQQGDVDEGVEADDFGRDDVAVRELDEDLLRPLRGRRSIRR